MKRSLSISVFAAVLAFSFTIAAQAGSRGPASEQLPPKAPAKSFTDSVKKVRDDDDGAVAFFTKTQGAYYLKRVHPKYMAFKVQLEESLKNKAAITVTYDSVELNILDVK